MMSYATEITLSISAGFGFATAIVNLDTPSAWLTVIANAVLLICFWLDYRRVA